MGQSFKAILQLTLIFACLAFITGLFIQGVPADVVWILRISGAAVAGAVGWILWKNARRKDLAPDFLREITPRYFERDGFCFILAPAVEDGVAWMNIFFQNRYDRPCVGRVVLKAPRKSFSLGRHPMPEVNVEIPCDGGAFGVCRVPWTIPIALQGKSVACEIGAFVQYAGGRGKLLRFREGLRVGAIGNEAMRAAATAGLLLVGVISISRPAVVRFRLPTGATRLPPPEAQPTVTIRWRPDLPTGGFPVQLAQAPLLSLDEDE